MTVEAYLRAKVPGYPFEMSVLENAAISPMFAKPQALKALELSNDIESHIQYGMMEEDFEKSLKYASSTLYYSLSGVFSGGSRSEQVGDVRASLSGFTITQADREYYRTLANRLRKELGMDVEEDVSTKGCLFDATYMTRKPKTCVRR